MSVFEDIFTRGLAKNIELKGVTVTIAPYDGSTSFTASAIIDPLVGAADEKNEANFQFLESDHPSASEGDRLTDPDGVVWTSTKITPDAYGGLQVQAFAPVEGS